MDNQSLIRFKGYAAANLMAMLLIGLTILLLKPSNAFSGTFIFSEFVIIPFLMGIVSTWFWRDLQLKGGPLTLYSCINGTVGIILSAIFLHEGYICLIIASPLLFSFIIAGAFAGRAMFKQNDQNLNISIFGLLLVIFITDSLSKHDYVNKVSDQIIVNAPVAKVWQYVAQYDRNKEPDKYWLFKAGMPSPMQSTVSNFKLGASRKCIFSNGYTFDEKIVKYDVNHDLTFDIINQPRDPEIMGHIDILRGQFLLKDNGNGKTILTGNSWYRLYVFPLWYYDTWAQSITRNVHIRVMEHIKNLAEAK